MVLASTFTVAAKPEPTLEGPVVIHGPLPEDPTVTWDNPNGLQPIAVRGEVIEEPNASLPAWRRNILRDSPRRILKSRDRNRPADWLSYFTNVPDTRHGKKPKDCPLEIIKVDVKSDTPSRGAVLLTPGLLQNAHVFDLDPKNGTSYARWLRETYGLTAYIMNPRGMGNSCYPGKLNIDDFAIDDIDAAVKLVSRVETKAGAEPAKINIIGSSFGGITASMYAAGLTRCTDNPKKNCFSKQLAHERAGLIASLSAEGVNVAMSADSQVNQMKFAAFLERLTIPFSPFMDRIDTAMFARPASHLLDPMAEVLGPYSPTYLAAGKYFFSTDTMSGRERKTFWRQVFGKMPMRVGKQYASAIRNGGLRATGGELYAEALKNIEVPYAQVSFEHDLLAEPARTQSDQFVNIGSDKKVHFMVRGQGHENFALSRADHASQKPVVDWMLNPRSVTANQGVVMLGVGSWTPTYHPRANHPLAP